MEDGQLVDLLKREELEAAVGPLSSWLHLGSRQPVPQGLGCHPKHLATDGKRKGCGHDILLCKNEQTQDEGLAKVQERSWKFPVSDRC